VAGFADIQGEGIHPKMIRTIIADKTTAAYSAQAVTAALFNREKTGQGQQIKISMLDAMISMLWPEGMAPFTIIADNNVIPPPSHDKIFKTSDGYITAGAVSDSEWQGMCKALEHPEWLDDPRFATQQLRNTNKDTRYELMASALETDTSDKWLAALDRHDVPCAPVLQRAQLFDNPQIINNEIISELEQPGVGPIRQARPAARFSKTPAEKPRPAPELGQHNNEILSELGFTQAEIDNLSETKIIG
jgi:crotonobetainyl-CoA:carnitine CoA-transferase CaiB-like acyl-CoA transferase